MNISSIAEYETYCVYRRRDKYLGSPFILKSESDCDEIDRFLKVINNYIQLSSYEELKTE